jgi:ADP-dependent NAD(P)H-hydrate dehydratase / NAD(P)H-hydrate epimerase
MKIFSAAQIKKWDAFTIANEPIASVDLMERAATACCHWVLQNTCNEKHFRIFCGKGNNGGDGLAIARLLIQNNCSATVYILEFGNIGSDDFQTNLERLHQFSTDIHFIQSTDFFPDLTTGDIIIDAIYGTGLNKPLEGISAALATHINQSNANIIAVDIPTGLFADRSSKDNSIIKAKHTLSFQNYKLAFLLPENEMFCGDVHLLNIGLHAAFEKNEPAGLELIDKALIKSIYKPRSKFAHKGTYGHAALVCGSYGMMGASVLSSLACLRSGAGKLTSFIPKCGYTVLQSTVPEAMSFVAGDEFILSAPEIEKYTSIGIGPGMGIYPSHKNLLAEIFEKVNAPMVIDADALNIIAQNNELLKAIPPHSIITPHPKEFEQLFGKSENDFERLELAKQRSNELNIYIVLKGHYSFISTPNGTGYFNSTGNAGMATGGSGDVLTGIITGLLAQGYSPPGSSLMGVYLHGLAGDHAAIKHAPEAMIAGDIIDCLGEGFKTLIQK